MQLVMLSLYVSFFYLLFTTSSCTPGLQGFIRENSIEQQKIVLKFITSLTSGKKPYIGLLSLFSILYENCRTNMRRNQHVTLRQINFYENDIFPGFCVSSALSLFFKQKNQPVMKKGCFENQNFCYLFINSYF